MRDYVSRMKESHRGRRRHGWENKVRIEFKEISTTSWTGQGLLKNSYECGINIPELLAKPQNNIYEVEHLFRKEEIGKILQSSIYFLNYMKIFKKERENVQSFENKSILRKSLRGGGNFTILKKTHKVLFYF